MADQLQDFVQHMLDSGAPKETIDEGIRLFQAQHSAQPVAADEPDTYMGGALKGFREGAVGGATGFVKGLVPGAIAGAEGVVTGPIALAKGAYNGVRSAVNDPSQAAHDALEAVKAAPGKVADMASAAAHKAAVDPEGFGNDVGNLTGNAIAGIAAGRAVPLAIKPVARGLGTGLQYAGEHPFATRMSGGAGVVAGIATGKPELVLGGLAAQAVPGIATKAGQALRIYSGESPAVVRLGQKAVSKLNGQFDEAMVKRGMDFYDEQAAAKANATRLAAVENAKVGRTATEPDIREATSATQPDGSKSSMSTTFKKAAPVADPNAPPPGWPAGVPFDPSRLGSIQPLRNGTKVTTLGGDRPSIRVMGKPAADLAATPASPIEQFLQSDPQARIGGEGRMTGQFKEGSGGLSDLQAGRIMPNGKAATDLAEGRVPTASRAPQPSDVRMDELAGKLGGQPTPVRVAPQDAIPASKSKGAMSATPGLTRADVEAIGMNPDNPIKALTPEMVDRIKTMRAGRHQTNYANARSDKSIRSMLEDSLLFQHMDRLR